MENKPNLKCCPFCGGGINIRKYDNNWYFACYKCGTATIFARLEKDLDKSIQAWNKRASDYDSKK